MCIGNAVYYWSELSIEETTTQVAINLSTVLHTTNIKPKKITSINVSCVIHRDLQNVII